MAWLSDVLWGPLGQAQEIQKASSKFEHRDGDGKALPFRALNIDREQLEQYFSGDVPTDDTPTSLTRSQLREYSRLSLISPFISLRTIQTGRHGVRRKDQFSAGAEIQMRDPKAKMTRGVLKEIELIWEVLERGAPFRQRLEAMARDSWTFDQANAEILWRKNKPYAWAPVDAATIRWAKPKPSELKKERGDFQSRQIVQVFEHQPFEIKQRFDPEEMIFGVRRPRTDVMVQGYGFPEIEEAVDVLSDLLFAKQHNSLFFRNGVAASTLMTMKSTMTPEMFRSFTRQMTAQVKGNENSHRMIWMLLNPGDGVSPEERIEKLDLAASNKDMEFIEFFGFLFRLLAAIMGVDLRELGLGDLADRSTQPISQTEPDQQLFSRERGLQPGLAAFEYWFNKKVIWPLNPDFVIRFLGLDVPSPEKWYERAKIKFETVHTFNEVRRENDLPDLPFEWANEVPLHPLAVQLYQLEKQGSLKDPTEGQEQPTPPDQVDFKHPHNWKASNPDPEGGPDEARTKLAALLQQRGAMAGPPGAQGLPAPPPGAAPAPGGPAPGEIP